MKSNVNYYRILNISPKANGGEIKKTYLRLARKYHPDKNKGNKLAERKFKQINEAYQILKDPQARELFDSKLKQKMSPPRQDTITVTTPDSFRSTPPKPRKSPHSVQKKEAPLDLETTLIVSLETICQNRSCVINYLKPENGKETKSSFSIRIPRGTQSGDWLLFKNKGGATGKKVFGDLYVKVQFKPHSLFTVKDWDVYLVCPVPFPDVFLRKKVIIPTLSKQEVQLKIPAGVSNETRLKLTNLGLPKKHSKEYGNMFVSILTDYPPNKKQKIQKEIAVLKGEDLKAYLKRQDVKKLHYSKVEKYKKSIQKMYEERKK
ncbi:MAG: DnaJ domain-containing protein [Bdellovibrionales bacterium]|nr:DnaJ domain-containing protein [Bdellovibrionales bacterium]